MVEGNFQIYRFQINGNIAIFAFVSPQANVSPRLSPGYISASKIYLFPCAYAYYQNLISNRYVTG